MTPTHPTVEPSTAGMRYAATLVPVGLASLVSWFGRPFFHLADIAMLHLLAVLFVASRNARGPSLFATFLSVAAFDFLFVPPSFTLDVEDARYGVTFAVMLAVGLTVSTFTVRLRRQAEVARERERRAAALYEMSQRFAAATEVDVIARHAVTEIERLLGVPAAVLLADAAGNLAPSGSGDRWPLDSGPALALAQKTFATGHPAGRERDATSPASAWFLPLTGARGVLGVVGLRGRPDVDSPSTRQLLDTFVAHTALALERAVLAEEAARARVAAETERTRSAFLSAVSHDLRTPLASITGSAGALLEPSSSLGEESRRELALTIRDEGERLGRMVRDLLELTRLEAGQVEPRRDWFPVDELVASALGRSRPLLGEREVRLDLHPELPLVHVDGTLFEQLFVNLLENAARHTPPASPIEIRAFVEARVFVLEMADRGPGLAPGEERAIFDRFHRTNAAGGGFGLGLTVCEAVARVHGGTIEAVNRPGGGALFRVRVPLVGTPPAVDLPELHAGAPDA